MMGFLAALSVGLYAFAVIGNRTEVRLYILPADCLQLLWGERGRTNHQERVNRF
jgi:hypothetical protein